MRLLEVPSTLLSLVAALALIPSSAVATPWLRGRSIPQVFGAMIMERDCPNSCGYKGWLCCAADQACQTINDQAVCAQAQQTANNAAAQNNGQWEMFTTTYTETDLTLVTSTYSSYIPSTTQVLIATTTAPNCQYALYEQPCGTTCCAGGQSCVNGVCVAAAGGGSSGYYNSYYTVTLTSTQAGTPPFRPTSGTVTTVTSTGAPTTTEPFVTPVASDGSTLIGTAQQSSGGGLSGGAIAGIVIGVIAGIIILLLICACCCFKGLIDGILGIFGLRNRRKRVTEEIIEERHHHSGGGGGGRRTWFGSRPSRVDRRESGGGGIGWAGVGAALATMAVVLGLKRRHDRKNEEKSSYGSSYYDSEYTSSSSASSDRRTRDSRRSRR